MHSNEKGKVAQDYFSLEFEFRVTQTGAYIFSMIQKKKKKNLIRNKLFWKAQLDKGIR